MVYERFTMFINPLEAVPVSAYQTPQEERYGRVVS